MPTYYGRCLTRAGGRKCTGRLMLAKLPAEYIRPPACPHCGGRKWYLDTNIVHRHKAEEKCTCEGYYFRHRKGSLYCVHHPNYEANWAARLDIEEQEIATEAWAPGRE